MAVSNRRDFFKNLGSKKEPLIVQKNKLEDGEDPLFKKYSRKTSGRVKPAVTDNKALRITPSASTLAPYDGSWTIAEVTHLLRRTTHGATKSQTDTMLASTADASIESLFNYTSVPVLPSPTPLNNYEYSVIPTPAAPASSVDLLGIPLGADWTKSNFLSSTTDIIANAQRRHRSLRYWTAGVYIHEGESIREKMTNFWYHFIPINHDDLRNTGSTNTSNMCHDYWALLRSLCVGNFKTLIKNISKSPAMLLYLSGQTSTKLVPNENFGRELFELFTLGKEQNAADNKYTEEDIKSASKIFSGWRMNNQYVAYPVPVVFNATYHNQENKQFSTNFENVKIDNQLATAGANEFDLFFDMLFTKQGLYMAKYLCRRLYRFFVYYEIDTNTETNIIAPLAQLLIDSNWEILPVIKKLLKSQHFFDVINRGVMIKSPFDFVFGMIRALNINTKTALGLTDYQNQYDIWNGFVGTCQNLEQYLTNIPNVAGWKAYYQAPTFYQNWINANTVQKREAFVISVLGGFTKNTAIIKFDPIAYVKQWPDATVRDPDLLIEALIKQLLPFDIDPVFKADTLKKASLLGNQTTPNYWTTAWQNYLDTPTDVNKTKLVTDRLKELFTGILKLAEFQLM
jgi:uncharacterized protein (DUF1800 family)